MITIGIELNHVVRNINKQILKFYSKAYNKGWDVEEMDTLDDALKIATFASKNEKYNFFYIDYPFELFASAETQERWLSVKLTNWLANIEDIEVMFPRNIKEVWDECDVVITANKEFLEEEVPNGKKVVLINRPFNSEVKDKAFANYDNLSAVIEDENFFQKLK